MKNLTLHLKELEKEEQTKPKVSRKRERGKKIEQKSSIDIEIQKSKIENILKKKEDKIPEKW